MKLNLPYVKEDNLPSLMEMENDFQKFDSINLSNLNYNEIKKAFFENIRFIPKLISPETTLNFKLYRTSCINESKLDITDIKTFYHPPKEYCPKGRCNLQNFPVFYASILQDTALRERRKENGKQLEEGDEVYISHWDIKKDTKISYSQFIYSDISQLGEIFKSINQNNISKLQQINKIYSEDKQNAFEYLLKKLSDYFISDDYTISSFLAHNILYDGRDTAPLKSDVLLYPSLQAGLNSINFAFHPDFAEKNLNLLKIEKIRFNSFTKDGSHLNLIKTGIPNEAGKIKWFTSVVNTNWMRIVQKEIVFEVDPSIEILDERSIFTKNGIKKEIDEIIWEYIIKTLKA
jgi:hypothetical protein